MYMCYIYIYIYIANFNGLCIMDHDIIEIVMLIQ
jgi:hypothetical protein